jgi:hypothetical protein
MISDLQKSIEKHKAENPELAIRFEIGSALFKKAFCEVMENEQYHRMTSNVLTGGDRLEFEHEELYVPLGLVERKKQTKRDRQEGQPEKGSELYHYEEAINPISHDTFFNDVLWEGKSKSQGKRIAIIGEPGAGKTTFLQKIAEWILEVTDDIPIWINLGALGQKTIREYLLEDWLRDASQSLDRPPAVWKSVFEQYLQEGKVWLLLDGVDEMGAENPLYQFALQLGEGWAKNVRIVLTCRLNVWEANKNELYRYNFDIYRNLDFDREQITQFIDNRFSAINSDRGHKLNAALDETGKERILDMVKNPLRLSLLCRTWQLYEGELPDTKAELYRQFVEAHYDWNRQIISEEKRQILNKALGKLALKAIDNEDSRFRLRESFIRQEIEPNLFSLALELGWLNRVGVAIENPGERVYAFYHPTFEEYFAALAIDNPDFFLKHIPEDPSKGNYRIFESQWYESYLLYLGRNDLTLLRKEELLNNLMNFQDNLGNLYDFQLFWIIAMGIPEFPIFSKSDIVIEIIIDFICNDIEDELANSMNHQLKKRYDLLGSSLGEYGVNILKDIAIKNPNVINFLLTKIHVSKNNNNVDHVIKLLYFIDLIDSSRVNLEENIRYIISNVENAECIRASYFTEILKNNYKDKPELLRILIEQIKVFDNVFTCVELLAILREIEPRNIELNALSTRLQKQCEQDAFANDFFELTIMTSEPVESSETCHEYQNIKHLSDFYRCLHMLYDHLLEINKNEEDNCFIAFQIEENYSVAIQTVEKILSTSDIVDFQVLVVKLFCFLLKILKADQAQIEVELFSTSYTVHLFISFFAVASQKIGLVKDKIIEIFINSLSIESKKGSFSPTGLTRIIQSNIHKMNLSKQEMIDIIRMIKNENIDIVVETEEVLFSPIISLFRDFAKCLDYPEFYQAWYGHPEIAQTLNQQILDLPSQLQTTEKTYPLIINAQSLEDETDNSSIAQELCNQIYAIAVPDETNIPEINNAPQLKRLIPNIKKQLGTKNVALIFHNGEPNETLIKFCKKLSDSIHIKWITEQPIKNGIPPQENLVNILQNWINQLD